MIAFASAGTLKQPESVTAAASHVVVFRLAGKLFALPVAEVREVLRPQEVLPLPNAPAFVEGVLSLRGRVIAVINLRKRFGVSSANAETQTRVVIARLPRALVGLIVDGVEEVVKVPASAVQHAPELVTTQLNVRYLKGIAQLGDKLLVLLNLEAIFSVEETQQLAEGQWQKSS